VGILGCGPTAATTCIAGRHCAVGAIKGAVKGASELKPLTAGDAAMGATAGHGAGKVTQQQPISKAGSSMVDRRQFHSVSSIVTPALPHQGDGTAPHLWSAMNFKLTEEALREGITEEEIALEEQKGSVEMRCNYYNQNLVMKMCVHYDRGGVRRTVCATHESIVVIPARARNIEITFQNTVLNFTLAAYDREAEDWVCPSVPEKFLYSRPPNRVYEIQGILGRQRVANVLDRYGQRVAS